MLNLRINAFLWTNQLWTVCLDSVRNTCLVLNLQVSKHLRFIELKEDTFSLLVLFKKNSNAMAVFGF